MSKNVDRCIGETASHRLSALRGFRSRFLIYTRQLQVNSFQLRFGTWYNPYRFYPVYSLILVQQSQLSFRAEGLPEAQLYPCSVVTERGLSILVSIRTTIHVHIVDQNPLLPDKLSAVFNIKQIKLRIRFLTFKIFAFTSPKLVSFVSFFFRTIFYFHSLASPAKRLSLSPNASRINYDSIKARWVTTQKKKKKRMK